MTAEFGDELRRYFEQVKERYGITQSVISDRVGISQPTFSILLSGARDPHPAVAESLLDVLRIPPEQHARFLLIAAGHSAKVADTVANPLRIRANIKKELVRNLQEFLEEDHL